MSAPILVPAFPAVLRVGLPVVEEEHGSFVLVEVYRIDVPGNRDDGTHDGAYRALLARGRTVDKPLPRDVQRGDVPVSSLRLDLRDPAVRDAVARAIWRKLRPGELEPLTAPTFEPVKGVWQLGGLWVESKANLDGAPSIVVPALAAIPLDNSDRDLLALAAVACAVLA